MLKGTSLVGDSVGRERVADDYYATPEEATKSLLAVEEIIYPAWEPACGEGHIAKLLCGATLASDLINRGYGETGDFLTSTKECATIITNPPFSLFQEFAERGLGIASHKVILFGKIQALEGVKRATFMQASPLKKVYVFKRRINPLRNGVAVDEKGKPWASTMCFAWFVWEKGYTGRPQIEWL
jgi:hypothetical protein